MLAEEPRQLIPRYDVHAVIEIDMPCTGDEEQLLRLGSTLVGIFAEFPGMRLVACDEEQGARRDRLDIHERVEIHELDIAGQRWPCCAFR